MVMDRLLLSKSKRSQIKKTETTPSYAKGEESWWPRLKSRVVVWGMLEEVKGSASR